MKALTLIVLIVAAASTVFAFDLNVEKPDEVQYERYEITMTQEEVIEVLAKYVADKTEGKIKEEWCTHLHVPNFANVYDNDLTLICKKPIKMRRDEE